MESELKRVECIPQYIPYIFTFAATATSSGNDNIILTP